ncbi:ABC transporter permease [Chamaesiphon sp. VAR_69_metabat_338]|uniref:ABC transporter permease n=1 Tax=Chamaesiphon sp. VAR_69_metabat_338 TaxID=2964704 RepID=UPI00286EAA49|nr:ABC transporter permease [Chamaesiphon sp. VAR_69_metabat_338]
MSRSKTLQYYLAARLLLAPLMLWTIVTLVFFLLKATPGDPADAFLGNRASEEVKAELRQQLGLDRPVYIQYFSYLFNLLRGDFGKSITSSGKEVLDVIRENFPATLELAIGSMLIAFIVGVTVGTISASRPGTVSEAGGRLFGIISYSLPIFWVGMLLQLIFAVQLHIFPLGGRFPANLTPPAKITGLYSIDSLLHFDLGSFFVSLHHLALPCLTLGVLLSGIFERIVRVNLKQSMKAEYVEAARARGISENKILISHSLKNAMIPVITVLGLTTASLLGGAVLTEVTFSWPGLASQLYEAISNRDYPTVQGIMVFFAAIVVIASILIDLINAWIDPRIKY